MLIDESYKWMTNEVLEVFAATPHHFSKANKAHDSIYLSQLNRQVVVNAKTLERSQDTAGKRKDFAPFGKE